MRRLARVLLRIVLGVVALVAIALGVLHTDWGREWIRGELEARLERTFLGDVTVGELEGSPLGRVTVRGFELRDEAGEVILAAESIAIDYRLASLLSRRFEASEVAIVAPVVRLDEGRPLLRPAAPGGEPWTVILERIEAERGTFAWRTADGSSTTLVDLSIAGSLRLEPGRREVALERLDGRWVERDLEIAARVDVTDDGAATSIRDAIVRAGDSSAVIPFARVTRGASDVIALMIANVRAEDVARFTRSRAARDGSGVFALRRVDGGEWEAAFQASSEGVHVVGGVEARGGTAWTTLSGWTELHASGVIEGVRVDGARLRGRIGGGVARAEVWVDTPRGRASGNAALRLSDGAWVLDHARLRGRTDDLGATLPGARGVDGAVWGEITARGRWGAIDVRGWIAAKRLEWASVRADKARVRFTLEQRRAGVKLRLGPTTIVTRALTWRGRGGAIAIRRDGSIRVDRVALASSAGRIEVTGALPSRARRREREQVLQLRVTDLDLAAMRAAFAPEGPPLRGTLDLDARLARRGRRIAIDARARAARLALGERTPPVDARAALELDRGRLMARARIHDPATNGAAELAIDSGAPRDALSARAWRRVDLRDVKQARLDLYQIDVAALATVVGRTPPFTGTVNGFVALAPRGTSMSGALKLRGFDGAGVRNAGANLSFRWEDELSLDGFVVLGGASFATIRATLATRLASALRDGAAWDRARIDAEARWNGYPVERLQDGIGLVAPIEGRVFGVARVRGALSSPTAEAKLRLERGRLAGVAMRAVDVSARLDPATAELDVRAVERRGGRLAARATLARADRAWDAELRARRFDLAALSATARSPRSPLAGAEGILDARARARGRLGSPETTFVEGAVRVERGAVRLLGQRLTDVSLAVRATTGRLILDRLSARVKGGTLRARGAAELAGLVPRRLTVDFNTRRLPVDAGRMVVGASVNARLSGGRVGEEWRLAMDVRDATILLPRQRRSSELQATGPLEDVVYVDPRGVAERARRAAAETAPPSLRVDIRAPRPVAVRGRDVRADLRVDLVATFRGGHTTYRGEIQSVRGDVELFGRRYELQRGSVVFQGESPPDPRLEIQLAHEFQTAVVQILVGGTLRRPELDLRSDPAVYDEAQLLGFVLGGDPDDPALARRPLDERAVGIASNLLAGQVQERLEEALPIDVLRLDLTDTSTGSLEVGKWLTDDVFVSYRHRFGGNERDENVHEASLEYRFARRWMIDLFFGDRGAGGADLLWSKRY